MRDAEKQKPAKPILQIKQEIGSNLSEIMSTLLFNNKSQAICELIANSYDADAPLVEIDYDSSTDSMIIKDNGDGMDYQGLLNFYRFGGSTKIDQPKTASGRTVLGRFGVAKSAIRSLAFANTLTTFKDGNKYSVDEVFLREVVREILLQDEKFTATPEADKNKYLESLIKQNKSIPSHIINSVLGKKISERFGTLDTIVNNGEWGRLKINKREYPANLKGTVIEMGPMRVNKNDGLDLVHLEKKIRTEYGLLLSDSFTVMLNGKKISPFKVPNAVAAYEIDTVLERCGKVTGKIFFSQENVENPGIHLYVDGREIGSGDIIDLNKIKLSLGKHMVGQIRVDALRKSIQLDRENIIYDDPKFVELQAYLRSMVSKIKTDLVRGGRQKQNKKVRSIFEAVSNKIDSYFEKTKLRKSSRGKNSRLKIELADSSKAGAFAIYDAKNNLILMNQDQYITYSTESSIFQRLEQLLLTISMFAISRNDYATKMPEHSQAVNDYLDHTFMLSTRILKHEKSKTLSQLLSGIAGLSISKNPDKMPIFDSRLYNLADLPDVTGRPKIFFKKLAEAGVMTGEGPWKGSTIREVCWEAYGYKALCEVVREIPSSFHGKGAEGVFFVEKENWLFMKISSLEKLPSYIKKIEGVKPVFLIKSDAVAEVLKTDSYTKVDPKKQDVVWGLMQSLEYLSVNTKKQMNAGTLRSINRKEPTILCPRVGLSEAGKSFNGYLPGEIEALADTIRTDKDFCIRYHIN